MAHFLGSALCHHTHLVPYASAKGPLQQRLQLAAPCCCLTLKKCFFSLVQCQKWQCSVCLYNVCVMYRSAHSGSQTTVLKWPRGSCQRASGLELELLVPECPSRGAAAEAAEKFTFLPGVLCWHHTLQAPHAKSIGEHRFYFLAPILHCLLFQVPISLNQNSYSAVPVEGQWCVLSWQWF